MNDTDVRILHGIAGRYEVARTKDEVEQTSLNRTELSEDDMRRILEETYGDQEIVENSLVEYKGYVTRREELEGVEERLAAIEVPSVGKEYLKAAGRFLWDWKFAVGGVAGTAAGIVFMVYTHSSFHEVWDSVTPLLNAMNSAADGAKYAADNGLSELGAAYNQVISATAEPLAEAASNADLSELRDVANSMKEASPEALEDLAGKAYGLYSAPKAEFNDNMCIGVLGAGLSAVIGIFGQLETLPWRGYGKSPLEIVKEEKKAALQERKQLRAKKNDLLKEIREYEALGR